MSVALDMDNTNSRQTLIKENEVLIKANDSWLHFTTPHRVIIAQRREEVTPALLEIERLIEVNDWYAAGFVSYEAASGFDSALHTKTETDFPLLWFGLYSQPQRIGRTFAPYAHSPGWSAAASSGVDNPTCQMFPTLEWQPSVGKAIYNSAIEQIRNYIAEGRTYQVNYTMRLQTGFTGSEWDFFLHLAQNQNKHAAYLDIGRYVICSSSPELFFQLDGDTILCQPMKGTVRRGRTTLEDEMQSQWLKNSEKNRAENVMIVDMIRNDLGRIARTGSVEAPRLFDIERYSTLWQMTSTVTAKTSASLAQIFTALFPSASITGAPKVGTMKIIAGLETSPRKIYTGSIGYIAPHRQATFNVAIRTALIDRQTQQAEYGVGGGIVWDSTSSDEYDEAVLKARVLTDKRPEFSLFETILWTPEEGFFLRDRHIDRMLNSAYYFDFPVSKSKVEEYLDFTSSSFDSPQRVRLLLDQTGALALEVSSFQPAEHPMLIKARLARDAVNSDNLFLFHKTTHREIYETARRDIIDCDDVLLFNGRGELTEFTIGNLVFEMDGGLYTPPISCGLLAGTFRAHLMETGQVTERTIHIEELKDCTKLFMVNSVRKWQEINLIG